MKIGMTLMTTEYYFVYAYRGEGVEILPVKTDMVKVEDGWTYFYEGGKINLALSPRTDCHYIELTEEDYYASVERLREQEAEQAKEREENANREAWGQQVDNPTWSPV